ncbi:MAG TPA: hypothetical protein VN841_14815 [Bryobacteraceae bacterium]|nr:hypothetical protein [Bryobacteraceae bacterium]
MKYTIWFAFAAMVAVAQPAAQPAQPAKPAAPVKAPAPRAIPRMADGHPDLEGIWQPRTSGAAYSILPHQGGFFLGGGSDTGVVEGGVLPYQPWAMEIVKDLTQHMEFDPTGHCHYEGIPHANYFGFQFFQTPTHIAVLYENMHARRIIYMTGSHPSDYLAWMGDSRGRWEGDTLVVDVANNNDKSVYDMAGHFHSDAEHVVERYNMVDHDNINWEATIDDPKVFTRPWKMKFPLRRAPKDNEIMESGCFEGERDAVHLVEGLAIIPADHYKQ